MSIAGPSTLRAFPRIASRLAHLPPRPVHASSAARFSTARPVLAESTRRAHALAQPIAEPSGFEGVPAPAYVEADGVGKGKGKAEAAPKRSIKAKKNAISMTPAAISRLRDLLTSNSDPKLLRIGVKTRGCAGMAYHLEYVTPPGARFDEVVEQDGIRVLIDSKALFSIIGSTMDWRDNRLSAGFMFDNPNIVDSCGCGESFNIR
ncbi:Iron-sulfur assembly protein 1 [Saitozyma sp. JCM 24511]|nr:Iron-sulfur assembly protein 1 [Saitozyma sp. JCM 24511]